MKPAMTSIAVTASVCASASEAALLVASFMQFSLNSGTSHRCPRRPDDAIYVLLGTPRDEYRLDLSPHSANIDDCQGRIVMRRHFDSLVTRMANARSGECRPKRVGVRRRR